MIKKITHSGKTKSVKKAVKIQAPFVRPNPRLPDLDLVMIKHLEEGLEKFPKKVLDGVRKRFDYFLNGEDKRWLEYFKLNSSEVLIVAKQGYLQFENGHYSGASRFFKLLAIVDPENYYHHAMLGAIAQRQDHWAEAILEYTMALNLNPNDVISCTNRGECFFRLGLFELAHEDLDRAVELDPQKKNAWANRARLLQTQLATIEKM